MILATKCILAPRLPSDGLRISTMSRHTHNDGTTPDLRITPDLFDIHLAEVAPPPKLIGAYVRGEMPWDVYEYLYVQHLHTPAAWAAVNTIAFFAESHDVTLLCIENEPRRCHRRLLALECRKLMSKRVLLLR